MDRDTLDLKFEMITAPEAKSNVVNFLRSYFFRDEPIVSSLKIAEDPEARKALENYATKSLEENISVMVLAPSNEMVGVALNSVKHKGGSKAEEGTGNKFDKVVRFLEFLEQQSNTFERFPSLDKFLSLDILSVHPAWRGKGISKLLVDKVRDFALSQGFKLIRIDCTSQYSAKAAVALGFEPVFSILYEDYKENGEQVFNVSEPHNEAKALELRINI